MYAIHYALGRLRQKKVPGDLVAVIGFDHNLDVTNRIVGPIEVDSSDFDDLFDATDISAGTDTKYTKYNFFPRVDARSFPQIAFSRALDMIYTNAQARKNVENHLVLFTDGFVNCYRGTGSGTCGDAEDVYHTAMAELEDFVRQFVIPNKIKLHAILAGSTYITTYKRLSHIMADVRAMMSSEMSQDFLTCLSIRVQMEF